MRMLILTHHGQHRAWRGKNVSICAWTQTEEVWVDCSYFWSKITSLSIRDRRPKQYQQQRQHYQQLACIISR